MISIIASGHPALIAALLFFGGTMAAAINGGQALYLWAPWCSCLHAAHIGAVPPRSWSMAGRCCLNLVWSLTKWVYGLVGALGAGPLAMAGDGIVLLIKRSGRKLDRHAG